MSALKVPKKMDIKRDTGMPHGDCLSLKIFTKYLSKSGIIVNDCKVAMCRHREENESSPIWCVKNVSPDSCNGFICNLRLEREDTGLLSVKEVVKTKQTKRGRPRCSIGMTGGRNCALNSTPVNPWDLFFYFFLFVSNIEERPWWPIQSLKNGRNMRARG